MTCEVCPICYDPIEGQFSRFDCECKLFYCQECFNDLKKHKYECPVCQREPNVPQIFMICAQIIVRLDHWFWWRLDESKDYYLLAFFCFYYLCYDYYLFCFCVIDFIFIVLLLQTLF